MPRRPRRSNLFARLVPALVLVVAFAAVPAPAPPAFAAACAVWDNAVLRTYDPCPGNVPIPECTVVAEDGSCDHWMLFSVDGSTFEVHECANDHFDFAIRARQPVPPSPPGSGPFCYGPPLPGIGAGEITPARIGMPGGATAFLVNLTMVDAYGPGYVTADRCSALTAGPQSRSNGNIVMGAAIANLSVIPIDVDGRFCLYNSVRLDLVADVQGYLAAPAVGAQRFVPISPRRLLDTRQAPATRPGAGAVTRVTTGLAAGASAALVNLTMVDGAAPGFVTADRCSVLASGPQSKSNGNHDVSAAIANLSVVPLDPDGSFCVFTSAPVNLIVDLQGSFVDESAGGLGVSLLGNQRVVDTRSAGDTLPPGTITTVATGAPAGTAAVLVNLTMTDGLLPGYVTADRCSALIAGPQSKSNGNHGAVNAIANLAVVPVDVNGTFCVYNSAPVNIVVDVQGAFAAGGALRFFPLAPVRVLDSRVSS